MITKLNYLASYIAKQNGMTSLLHTITIVTAQHQQTHTRVIIPIMDSNPHTRGSDGRTQCKVMPLIAWYSKNLYKKYKMHG